MRSDGPSEWRDRYIAALQEVDREKLLPRIYGAKLAIWDRLEQVGEGRSEEHVALHQAMSLLCKLQGLYFSDASMNEVRAASPKAPQVNLPQLQHCVAGD